MKIVQSEAPAHEIHHTWSFSGRLNRTGGSRPIAQQCKRMSPRSRGTMRPSLTLLPTLLNREGAGKAGCALHPRSRVQECTKCAHEHTGSAEASGFSLHGGLRLTSRSPVTGFLATVIPEKRLLRRDLTPASGCQDHTTSPSAASHDRRSWPSRPPHPTARS
jgi:hypothetical protein